MPTSSINLETSADRYVFDADSGRLVSLVSARALGVELLASTPEHPALALQVLTTDGEYRLIDSHSARTTSVESTESDAGQILTSTFSHLGGMDIDVALSVRASGAERFSRWSCTVRNGSGARMVDVQFPFVVVPTAGAVILPAGHGGVLIDGDALRNLPSDDARRWQFLPENGPSPHYPGRVFAQFIAWSHGDAGVYMACNDTEGNVKRIAALRREPGVRLGVVHVGDWPAQGERTLEYEVLLGSFAGDWVDAADIYRDWSLQQKWATPLTRRTDVPEWLLDSPPHITIRLQGYVDAGHAPPIEQFLPYEKCMPLLAGIADRVEASLVAVLMSWEHAGPWVYPDCFPPVGGDQSMARFIAMARERGWHVGSFCNGTRWVLQHLYNGYDGREEYRRRGGAQSVCRLHNDEPWGEVWDRTWRPSRICCMAQELTKRIATDFVERLLGWGMESIQFFDQNCNAATFPCFAADHGHPPLPGKWMAQAMEDMTGAFRKRAAEAGELEVIQSTECPCNEYCLPLFQQSDVRVSPPCSGQQGFIPLYHYLFHECTIMHGMMSTGGEPYALPIRNAWNAVWGEIPGAVMTGDGTLLNRETFNWAEWEPKVGSNDDALEMIRTVTAMRRGPGRDFLVYGRMQRPAHVESDRVEWEHNGRHYAVPAVADAAWRAPAGKHGVILANWTTEERVVTIADARLSENVTVHTSGRELQSHGCAAEGGSLRLPLPALSCTLIADA